MFDVQAADALLKTDLAAELFDLAAHLFDHADQPEGTDVRFADVENLRRGTGLDEFHQHLAPVVPGVLDLAVELAVGKGAGAAFAELHVRFRVELLLPPQSPGILGTLAHCLATLENDRPESALRQDQGGKDAGRAETDDDRSRRELRRRLPDEVVAHVRCRLHLPVGRESVENRGGVGQRHVDTVEKGRRTRLARVATAPEDADLAEVGLGHAEASSDRGSQRCRRMLDGKANVADPQQGRRAQGCWP